MLVAVLVAIALPAGASAGAKGCTDGAYCLWKKPNYRGDKLVVKTNALFNFPRFMNNRASSFKNRAGGSLLLYKGKDGNDGISCSLDGASFPTLPPGINNEASSGEVTACGL
jgi:hypothetical protein